MNRICVYAFFDKDGIMDEYVFFFLSSMLNYCSKIICVVNGDLKDCYLLRLQEMKITVYKRDNIGFDAMAYTYGIQKINDITQYDELIICNNSFFGPIYSLDNMFSTMEKKLSTSIDCTSDDAIDFWGMSIHPKKPGKILPIQEFKYINEHVQTFFVAFSKKTFTSSYFAEFWNNLPIPNSFLEAVCLFELKLTSYFSKVGFKYNAYINHKYYGDINAPILYPCDTIEHCKCPFIKRKVFTEDYNNFFEIGEGTSARYALELAQNLGYDTNLIWDHILRTAKMSDIRMNLQLNYTISSELTNEEREKIASSKKIALILYVYYADAIDECLEYAQNMPLNTDIYLVSSKDDVISAFKSKKANCEYNLDKFNKVEFIKKINKGRELSTYLIDCRDLFSKYDYLCFFHDKRSPHLGGYLPVRSFFRHCMDSLLPTREFVTNLIYKFEKEPRLGMLVPPPLHYGPFYTSEYVLHQDNKKWMLEIMKELSLNVPFDDFPVAPYGDMFWIRGSAIKNLYNKNWSYDDLPNEPIPTDGTILHALERIIPLVVQSNKLFTAWCCSEDSSRTEITNLYHIDKTINKCVYQKIGELSIDFIIKNITKIQERIIFSLKTKLLKYTLINVLTLNLISKFKVRQNLIKEKIDYMENSSK